MPYTPVLPAITPVRVRPSTLSYESTTTCTTANLQSTINAKAALSGSGHHEIIVQDGQLYTIGINLPPRSGGGTGKILIRSQTLPCMEGIQVHPTMFTTQSEFRQTAGGYAPIISTENAVANVHDYVLVGLLCTSTSPDTNAIVAFGYGSSIQNSLSLVPYNLWMDRCSVRGENCRRALNLHSGYACITESYLSGAYLGSDSQAIYGANGPGPYLIEHNVLQGAGENTMFGGQSNFITNMNPSDITIRLNCYTKSLTWYAHAKSIKNIFELKCGIRVLVEGNFFENCWSDEQSGIGILLKTADQDGIAPWMQTKDVTFRYNFCRNFGGFVNLSAYPQGGTPAEGIAVYDNIMLGMGADGFTGDDRSIQMAGAAVGNGGDNFQYYHNTVVMKNGADQQAMAWLGGPLENCQLRDNIDARYSGYGIRGDSTVAGLPTWEAYTSGVERSFERNIICTDDASDAANYPGSWRLVGPAGVGFVNVGQIPTMNTVNPTTAAQAFKLANSSPYKGLGSGGRDPGADIDAIVAFLVYSYVPGQRSDDLGSFVGPGPNIYSGAPTPPPTSAPNVFMIPTPLRFAHGGRI